MKKLLATIAILFLAGCASYKPVPEGYAGPVATISDTGSSEDATKAQIFALVSVDGNPVPNSFGASRQASFNQGPFLNLRVVDRQVPAQPMKVKIRASHATGAPIHEIASRAAGTFYAVEGEVDFKPEPNGRYLVKGELARKASSVWIEDAETNRRVTEKVVEK